MSQKTEDRSYNLRPRTKGNVIIDQSKSSDIKQTTVKENPSQSLHQIKSSSDNAKKSVDNPLRVVTIPKLDLGDTPFKSHKPVQVNNVIEYGCEDCAKDCNQECECDCHGSELDDDELDDDELDDDELDDDFECDCGGVDGDEECEEDCECDCHFVDDDIIDVEIPPQVMDDINKAIQDLVEEVTEDIIQRISEIVVKSVENNMDGENEEMEDDDGDNSEYKPTNIFSMFDSGFSSNDDVGMFPRQRMYLTKNRWKTGLTEEEVKKYSYLFDELKSKDKLNIPQIIRANLSEKEKERAIKKFLTSHPGSVHSIDIVKTIKQREQNPISEDELRQIDELDAKLCDIKDSRSTLKEKIYKLKAPLDKKSAILEKYLQLESLSSSSTESSKLREWLNWATKLPWDKSHNISVEGGGESITKIMSNIKTQLDKVYGLKNAKEEIMIYVLRRLIGDSESNIRANTKTSIGGQILAIEGSPGVGKTYLLKHLASALNIPFESIPLGGCKDSSFLDGHGYTYEGSVPGRLVQALKNMGCNNGIIYFDEIDKLSESQHGQEVSSLMLHILDPSQNKEFYDKYIGDISIDLSKIFFVLSINDREKIDPVLRQRLFIIKIPDPTVKDKIQIAKQCMIPSIETEFGFSKDDIIFPEDTLYYIINTKTNDEKGVRNFNHLLLAIYKRLLFLHKLNSDEYKLDNIDMSFWINDFKLPFVVSPDVVNHLLKGTEQISEMNENIKKLYL